MTETKYRLIGQRLPRVDAFPKVVGSALFVDDMIMSGMLVGKVLASPVPHARLLGVDVSRASKLPGVRAVITSADLPETLVGAFIKDMPVLARNKLRFQGEPVAAVAALNEEAALAALAAIKLEYEELPVIFDPDDALKPGAPLLHEDVESYKASFDARKYGNVSSHTQICCGDLVQGFKEAEEIFEDEFCTNLVHQAYIETAGVLAHADPTGNVTAWASTQSPHLCRIRVAEGLLIAENKIRIISAQVGGAFGGKEDIFILSIAIALSQRAGRPVKIILTRKEEFSMTRPRHPAKIRVKSGVKKDGAIVARQVQTVFNTGAYADQGPGVCGAATSRAMGPYRIPNFQLDGYVVYTNHPICGAYRGYGSPQVSFAVESHMDIIAEKLALDPVEFRMRNAIEAGDKRLDGQIMTTVGLKDCLAEVSRASGWQQATAGGRRGRGVALVQHISGNLTSGALVKINQDGTVTVCVGAVDMGTGSATTLAQMAAEELGLPLEDINMVMADTDATPYDWSTAASRTTFVSGNAVTAAAADAKSQLFKLAASKLEANPEDLVSRDRKVFVQGTPEKALSFRQLGMLSHWVKGGAIIGKASHVVEAYPMEKGKAVGMPLRGYAALNFGAQAVEVEVDEETGDIRLLGLWAALDCGQPINPTNVEGQIEGAFAQGLGYALFERIHLERGKVLNPNFTDYKLPTSLDIPASTVTLCHTHEPTGPFGAKGVGEAALVPTAAAIANAVYQACGVRLKSIPLSREEVLQALRGRAGVKGG